MGPTEVIRRKRKGSAGRWIGKPIVYFILSAGGLIMLYPLLFGFFGSIVTEDEFYRTLFLPWPENFFRAQWRNFILIFDDDRILPSIVLTLAKFVFYAAVNIVTSVTLGFLFAKMRFKGKKLAFTYLLVSMMIPGIALTVPNYVWLARFPLVGGNDILGRGGTGFVDNPAIVWVLAYISPYNIFFCRQALSTIPDDYKEAAEVDGMGTFRIIFQVYTHLLIPVIALMLFNQFCAIWNDYMFSIVYLPTRGEWYTIGAQSVQVAAVFSTGGGQGIPDYPKTFAVALITMLPPVVAYIFMQRKMVDGLSMGGLKG